jgi:hypothetical protein
MVHSDLLAAVSASASILRLGLCAKREGDGESPIAGSNNEQREAIPSIRYLVTVL